MVERIFFNRLVTKNLTATDSDRRYFEGYLTVQIVDKQNEITIVDELMKVLPKWVARGAPISDTHSNRIVGKGINFQKTMVTEEGVQYPAIFIQGEIYKDYELDDEVWKNIQTGKYKGLSFGGATKSERVPITNEDGTTSYALKDLEHYEVAVCEDPAVPLAIITDFNPIAKSMVLKNGGKYIQKTEKEHCIRCFSFGCYIDKADIGSADTCIPSETRLIKSWQDTKITDDDRSVVQGHEWSDTDGVNRPQKDDTKVTSGNQQDPTGEDPTFRGAAGKTDDKDPKLMVPIDEIEKVVEEGKPRGSYPSTGPSYNANPVKDEEKSHKDEEEKDKTINPGENMNMEKPIRGLRGTGGMGTGAGDATRINQSYDNALKELKEKYDYDMSKIVNDETVNDPRKEDDKDKSGVPQAIQAESDEDGVKGKTRISNDPPADALAQPGANSSANEAKSTMTYAQGGTRGGSYESTSQDSQQWDRQVTNPRDTKRINSGEKDSLNTLNRAVDKLNAIEIRRAVNKIYIL